MSKSRHILLVTGSPGVGKTTVIRRVAERLKNRRIGGFYTEEIRAHGQRQGFRLQTFDGQMFVMAHVDLPKTHRVSRYGVDVSTIDAVVDSALNLEGHRDLYLVDEIGKMECFSSRFINAVRNLADSDRPLVATVAEKGSGLIAEVKQRVDVELWRVTAANRDALPARVVAWLSGEA
jgi:nucleoside-triphosphatase